MRQIIALFFAGLLILQCGCNVPFAGGSAKFKRAAAQTVPHQPASLLRVESANGSIAVTQVDRTDVLINSEIKASTQERLELSEVVIERHDNGELFVEAVFPEKRQSGEGCSFEIEIPEAIDVALTTSNGRIKLFGLGGNAILRTSNGSVSVQEFDGSVEVKTSNGKVSATDVNGSLRVKTSNGSVNIENAVQPAAIETSNGSISLSQSTDSTGPIDLKTSNASVQVDLCSGFSGTLEIKTSNGSIKNSTSANTIEKGKNKLLLDFEGDAAASRINTSNGSVTVRQSI